MRPGHVSGGVPVALTIKVTLGGNSFAPHAQAVVVPPGDTVRLEVHDSRGVSVDGTWRRGTTKLEDGPTLDVRAAATTMGTHTFSARTKGETATVELKLGEQRSPSLRKVLAGSTWAALVIIVAYAAVSLWLVGTFGLDKVTAPPEGEVAGAATTRSALLGVLTLVAMLALAEIAGRAATGTSGVMDLVKGKDRRASNSKIQYLLWTLLLGFILAYIAGYSSIVVGAPFECAEGVTTFCVPTDSDRWGPYLVLLGVPAAAAVTAKGVVSYKVSNGTLQKSEAQQTALAQVVNNDNGDTDIVDVQYLVFNLIAFVYVLAMFATKKELADVPDLLLGLTSTAAGTYVLNKSLASNKPRITSVVPSRIKPGDVLAVRGENLLVVGPDGECPAVLEAKVAGVRATATVHPGQPDTLVVTVPAGTGAAPPHVLTVVTAANVEAEGFPVTVEPVVVVGWADARVPSLNAAAARVRLVVTGLSGVDDLDEAERRLRVVVAGVDLAGTLVEDGVVAVDVPRLTAITSPVEVRVAHQGRTSETAKLPIA